MKIKKGYTLIELIVGFGLFALLATTVTMLIASLLQNARKAAAVAAAKTEGEYAMAAMAEMIRYSGGMTCSANSLTVGEVTYNLYTSGADAGRMSSESGTMIQYLTSARLTATPCGGSTFVCPDARTVEICFWLDTTGALDASEQAGGQSSNGVQFRTRVGLRNFW